MVGEERFPRDQIGRGSSRGQGRPWPGRHFARQNTLRGFQPALLNAGGFLVPFGVGLIFEGGGRINIIPVGSGILAGRGNWVGVEILAGGGTIADSWESAPTRVARHRFVIHRAAGTGVSGKTFPITVERFCLAARRPPIGGLGQQSRGGADAQGLFLSAVLNLNAARRGIHRKQLDAEPGFAFDQHEAAG